MRCVVHHPFTLTLANMCVCVCVCVCVCIYIYILALLMLYSYFTHSLLMLSSYFTHILLMNMLGWGEGVKVENFLVVGLPPPLLHTHGATGNKKNKK
jgi:hypothetical protein